MAPAFSRDLQQDEAPGVDRQTLTFPRECYEIYSDGSAPAHEAFPRECYEGY
jgi:hypothetical protein